MALNNFRVVSFVVSGSTTFDATAAGVYITSGSAITTVATPRIQQLPYGGLHDLDGTAEGALSPGRLTSNFFFTATSPALQTPYSVLQALLNKHGTLNLRIPAASTNNTYSALARLIDLQGDWQPIYMQGRTNYLKITATWQLKAYPA